MEMKNNQKGINFTCHAFIWCMNISFVISMSQVYEYQFFHYVAVFLDVIAVLFLFYHYVKSALMIFDRHPEYRERYDRHFGQEDTIAKR